MTATPLRVAILTVSTRGAAGERQDTSGDAIRDWALGHGYEVSGRALVPDDTLRIAQTLSGWADAGAADVILTTGGTGLSDRDITPEATRAVIEKDAPGIAEFVRAHSTPAVPRAALSRGLAGTRGATLIVNLPGSRKGVEDGLAALDHLVPHAVEILKGNTEHGQ